MGRCRVVQPEVVRIEISDGDFLDVKKQLNIGEYRRQFAEVYKQSASGGQTIDLERIGKTKLLAYLVGWSFVDLSGAPLSVSESSVDALDTDTYQELVAAIDAHETTEQKARAARKNVQDGERASSVISPSVGS